MTFKLSRFGPKQSKSEAAEAEADEGGIAAWQPSKAHAHQHQEAPQLLKLQRPQRSRRASKAGGVALVALLAAMALLGAISQRQGVGMEEQHHHEQRERARRPGAGAVPASGIVGSHYRSHIRDGPEPRGSSLWDAACTGGAAEAHRALWQNQTNALIASGAYQRRRGGPPAAGCRSDAPAATPLPQLRSLVVLRSGKPRPEGGVTVMTQLSLERLAMLEQQCSAWPHPLAAVVYLPLLGGRVASADDLSLNGTALDAALLPVLRLHARAEAGADESCILDLEVVVELHCDMQSATLYPANAARNRALRLVQTEAVVLLDVDFVVSHGLAARMASAEYRRTVLKLLKQPLALVLPAFETAGGGEVYTQLAVEVARAGKAALLQNCLAGKLVPFHQGQYSKGHKATDYGRWAVSSNVYEVAFQAGFEPYILIHRKHVPYYDERLRGYFVNKLLHRAHLASLGIRWGVHPAAFVLHLPHRTAKMKSMTRSLGLKEYNNRIFGQSQVQMQAGRYLPYVADPSLCYTSDLLESQPSDSIG